MTGAWTTSMQTGLGRRIRDWWQQLRGDGAPPPLRAAHLATVVVLAVTLREVGVLLSKIDVSGQTYGPGVFTGLKLAFWDVADLRAAVGYDGVAGVWEQGGPTGGLLVRVHLGIDLLFAVVVSLLLARLLTKVAGRGTDSRLLVGLPLLYLAADLVETAFTYVAIGCGFPDLLDCDLGVNRYLAGAVHLLADAKWLLFAANVIAIIALFVRPSVEGQASMSHVLSGMRARTAGRPAVVGPPGGVLALVALFVVLVAVPAGGPLDQFPDVLRAQFDHLSRFVAHPVDQASELVPLLVSALTMGLFVLLIYFVVARAIKPSAPSDLQHPVRTMLWGSATLSLVLLVGRWIVDGRPPTDTGFLPTLAPLIVTGSLLVLGWFVGLLPSTATPADRPTTDEGGELGEDIQGDAVVTGPGMVAIGFAASVVAAVVLAAAVGGIRALLPVVLVRDPMRAPMTVDAAVDAGTSDTLPWVLALVCLALAYVVAVGGTAGTMRLICWRLDALANPTSASGSAGTPVGAQRGRRLLGALPRGVEVVVYAAFILAATAFASDPDRAGAFGATGTTTLSLGALILVFAGLGAASRRWRWPLLPTGASGRTARTSWATLLLATWLLASQLDVDGGYHDARTVDVPRTQQTAPQRTRTIDSALTQWLTLATSAGRSTDAGCLRNDRMPMVFVAAPGGGARAMYWTAAGLDRLFTESDAFCPQSLFAASGVSGGAVGLATRLAVDPGTTVTDQAARMAEEAPLAATIAAMVLRDLPQAFTGIRSSWRDRAAVLEDQWAARARAVFADTSDPGRVKVVEQLGQGWWTGSTGGPVLALNGSSVADGCRVVVGTIHGFSGNRNGCLDAPDASAGSRRDTGILSATNDVAAGLAPSTVAGAPAAGSAPDDVCVDRSAQTLPATTAALLAARFPYVTPSGALRRCPPAAMSSTDVGTTTYIVDGGYLENTGLLTLTQLWGGVADRVAGCNRLGASITTLLDSVPATSGVRGAQGDGLANLRRQLTDAGCPLGPGDRPILIEPWLVVLENHYGSEAAPRRPQRPKELFVPPSAAAARSVTTGTVALEQAAVATMTRDIAGTGVCNRFLRLSPGSRPGVEAPLGWVLSEASKASLQIGLDRTMRAAIEADDDGDPTGRC